MIKDIFDSFKENVKQKTANPFFATLIIILAFKNWKIIYAIFNFDEAYTLEAKIEFISSHISSESFLIGLGWTVLWTFIVLIITYALLNISRLIINFYEKRITPIIYKITDTKDIVLKTDYDSLLSENERLKQRLGALCAILAGQ